LREVDLDYLPVIAGFVQEFCKEDFLDDKRTQQAVIMSLIIIGEAATKLMDQHP